MPVHTLFDYSKTATGDQLYASSRFSAKRIFNIFNTTKSWPWLIYTEPTVPFKQKKQQDLSFHTETLC